VFKSIGQVANYKPLTAYGMEELAERQKHIEPSGGILFARNGDGEAKMEARQYVIDLFLPQHWPHRLHMLTMPSLQWRFERKLLGVREVGWLRAEKPRRTYFTSCENDRAIYYSAVTQMPGLHTAKSALQKIKPYAFAEMGVKTRYASFFFADIDALMGQDCWEDGWDAVWLDYTGPLSIERMELIHTFYRKYVRQILIITALKARWNLATSRAIDRAGSHADWVCQFLDGNVLHDLEYQDTASPMAQIAIRKGWRSCLV
jgi:hypothetical protein